MSCLWGMISLAMNACAVQETNWQTFDQSVAGTRHCGVKKTHSSTRHPCTMLRSTSTLSERWVYTHVCVCRHVHALVSRQQRVQHLIKHRLAQRKTDFAIVSQHSYKTRHEWQFDHEQSWSCLWLASFPTRLSLNCHHYIMKACNQQLCFQKENE